MGALFDTVFNDVPIAVIGIVLLGLLWGAMQLGILLRRRSHEGGDEEASAHEGYIVSGALGLLALLLGFTFALAIDRYDNRRALVLEEANAIGTTYLRAQLLDEPFRSRVSRVLVSYTDNRLALAGADTHERQKTMMAQSDALQARLWSETVAAIHPIRGLEIASGFVETVNATIDAGAARVAARQAHVPSRVLVALLLYMVVSAAVLGYVMSRSRRRTATAVLLGLVTLAYLLILDIDRPVRGGIRESQAPMEQLRGMMKANPPAAFGPAYTS